MKRYLIHVSTNWCGMDQKYPALAESEQDLWDVAEELAYENFANFGLWEDIAEEHGYNPSEMTDEEWDILQSSVDDSDYYSSYVEEFDGTEEEWNLYAKDGIYGPKGLI